MPTLHRHLPSLAAIAAASLLALLPGAAWSQVGVIEPEEGVNMLALGIGSIPDYLGSDDRKTTGAIIGRYYFSGRRYVQLWGPQLSANVLDHPIWQFGPQIVFRMKRDDGVDDPVVRLMRPIDSDVEGGVFGAGSWQLSPDPRHRFIVRGDVQGGSNGVTATATANYFVPVSRAITLNIGGGFGFANDKWANTYFGINGTDIALFPSLGGRPFVAGGGLTDIRINFGAIFSLSEQWHIAAGARYQSLQGDVADSPVVSQRGTSNQWIYGVMAAYVWR